MFATLTMLTQVFSFGLVHISSVVRGTCRERGTESAAQKKRENRERPWMVEQKSW